MLLLNKIFLRILVNTLIGVALVIVWLQFVNIAEILESLKKVNPLYLTLILIFFALSTLFRSIRLRLLLKSYPLNLINLIYLNSLGQFLSFFIPLRAGEITKSIYFSTKLSIPLGKSLIWVLLDRFLDFWVNLLMVSILILVIPTTLSSEFVQIVFAVLVTFSLVPVLMIKSAKLSGKLIRFAASLLIFNKLKNAFLKTSLSILEGFEILHRHLVELLGLIVLSVLAGVSDALIWLSVFYALGFKIGFLENLLGSLMTALTFLVPAAPGYIGSAEASGLLVYSAILGVESNLASAAALLSHIAGALCLLIFGLTGLYLLKFNLSSVFNKILRRG